MVLRRATWRLVKTPPAPGAWNMAVDEAILEQVETGQSLPTLRLYAWQPPCLSLGYAQPAADVDREALAARGWDLVRRPTGGRAILHTDELTYSVIAPPDEPRLRGSILESYQRLARALLSALRYLRVPAQSEEKRGLSNNGAGGPVCFEVPSSWEITVDGKKMIGSAQVRRRGGVLQHGTLPLHGDLARITRVLQFSDPEQRDQAAAHLLERAVTLEAALGRRVSWQETANALVGGFESALNVDFIAGALSPQEEARALELLAKKYDNPAWTNRV